MKAIVAHNDGNETRLVWEEVPDVIHQADEVLVDIHASAVNRADLMQAQGKYPPPPGVTEVLGLEMAGEIVAVGAEVDGWAVGDRVCALLPGGGYAERVAVPAGMLLRLPDDWTYAQGAAVPEVWLTAFVNLFREGSLVAGETVLLHAAGSGVGTAAIQLARTAGATVFATAGADFKLARARELGAELTVNYKEEDWLPPVQAASDDKGVNLILDPVGADYFERNLQALAWKGRLVMIGLLSGGQTSLNLGLILGKRLRLIGSTLRSRPVAEKIDITQAFAARFWEPLTGGAMSPIIDIEFDMKEAGAAHAYVAADKNLGKVILTRS